MKLLVLLCLVGFALAAPNLWPLPQKYSSGNYNVVLDPENFPINVPNSPILKAAVLRYQDIFFPTTAIVALKQGPLTLLPGLTIKVSSLNETLVFGVSEAYTLEVPLSGPAVITADTVFGALRGLETFAQLLEHDINTDAYTIKNVPWSIVDFPRFSHRGLLLDTSRHYMPLNTIYKVLDAMAATKMNVLHWHVVDSQAYPLQSIVRPKLWDGAWSPYERYSLAGVKKVSEYAHRRGIRVMMEIDGPGHAWSFGVGYPEVLPANFTTAKDCVKWNCADRNTNTCNVPLDPSKEATYSLLSDVLGELMPTAPGQGMLPDDMFHLGGDEVESGCWAASSEIASWMKTKGFTTYNEAYEYFVARYSAMVRARGRAPVHWEEVFNHFGSKLDKSTIIHVWLDLKSLPKIVNAGYKALVSNNDAWYLDHTWTTWQSFYKNEPCTGITAAQCAEYVLGGEACAWSESQDISDVFARLWPRGAATAERLWSSLDGINRMNIDTDVAPRLAHFRCHVLHERGIASEPLTVSDGYLFPRLPGSCFEQ